MAEQLLASQEESGLMELVQPKSKCSIKSMVVCGK
jgi:hypothetical protein